jgi:hypothetical protein
MDSVERAVAYCPHCGNRAPQTVVRTQTFEEAVYSMSGDDDVDYMLSVLLVTECGTCKGLLVYYSLPGDPGERDFREATLQWPKRDSLDDAVPKSVRSCYEEASLVRHRSATSFAVQIRRALEAMCADRGATGRTLQQQLHDLARKGEIPPVLAQMTTALRTIGNAGAHAGEGVRRAQVYPIDQFFRAVIEYVYVAPARLDRFRRELARAEREAPV